MEIETIFTYPKEPDWKSKLTKFFLKTNYDHVAIKYINENGRTFVFETGWSNGTWSIPEIDFSNKKNIVQTYKVPLLCNPQRFYGFIDGMQGKPYSKIFQPLTALMIRLGLPFRFFNGARKSWCSETVAMVLGAYCGVAFAKKLDTILPTDIEEKLRSSDLI